MTLGCKDIGVRKSDFVYLKDLYADMWNRSQNIPLIKEITEDIRELNLVVLMLFLSYLFFFYFLVIIDSF